MENGDISFFRGFILSFTFPFIVLIFHVVFSSLGFYYIYWWFDIPMHFLGGFSIGITSSFLLSLFQKKQYLGKINFLLGIIFVVSMVSLTAVGWEFFEFLMSNLYHLNLQPSLNDTLADLFFGIFGGIIAGLIFSNKIKH